METENMNEETKRVEVMDSMLDWELLLDSRVDGEDRVLEELEVSFRDPDKVFTTEQEDYNVSLILELIGQTEYTEKATRCLCLLVRYKLSDPIKLTFIGDKLCDLFSNIETMAIALKAIKTLIVEMPALDILWNPSSRSVQLARRLVESLAPRIVGSVNKHNVTESFDIMGMLIRHFGSVMRTHAKLEHMRFLGQHYFCTGVELGKGAFATVYLGLDTKTAEVVAIKTMDWNRLTSGRDKVRIALENEIRIMRETDHPNIVKLHEALREGCYLHLILEYCGGGSLEEYLLKRGRLSEEETLHWLHELALGLRFLRENSLVHRDLKPGNLLLSVDAPTASLKITDFTFARFLEAGDLATSFVGTPLYMAPEIFTERSYTEKSDLWSVGVLIYQMLTAGLPYRGDNFQDLLLNIKKNELTWPDDLRVSADIKDLVRCLLQKQPDLRISWTEFFMHPCLRLLGGQEEEDEEPAPLDESVIVTTDPMIQSVIVTTDPEAALKAATAELESLKKELKEAKEELVMTKERLAHSEEEKEDYAARFLMAEFAREQGEQKENGELEKLREEKIKADAEIDRLKNQILLIATSKIKECSTEELDTLRSENTSLKETLESLTKELEVYKVALQLEAADAGVSSNAWKKYFS